MTDKTGMTRTRFEERVGDAKQFLEKKGFIIGEDKLKGILAAIDMGFPLLVVGATGTGKTMFFNLLAEWMKAEYFYASLNGSVAIEDLTQERVLGKNGSFEEQDMILAKWLRSSVKGKSILQLDEVNAAKPETLLAMHPIMDLKKELRLPFSDEVLKVTDNAVLVMSCNEGDEYAGINAMNMAFQNRFVKVHFSYLGSQQLTEHLSRKTGVDLDKAAGVVRTWEKYMRTKEYDQPVVSIRMLEWWCEMSKLIGLKEAGKYTFGGVISDSEEALEEVLHGDFWVNLPD